jgi:hypothetical protein
VQDLVGVDMAQDLENFPQELHDLWLAERLAVYQLVGEVVPGNELLD